LVFFSNPALALLGQSLKKIPIRQKLNSANHPYLYKGLKMKNSIKLLLTSMLIFPVYNQSHVARNHRKNSKNGRMM
jgi:hypothetical protein